MEWTRTAGAARRVEFRLAAAEPEAAEVPSHRPLAAPLRRAILRTRQWILSRQESDGHWCAELEGDTILESEYILLLAFLGREDSPIARRCANHLVDQQREDGGWAMYPGGRVEISASVKAYFALKLTGHDPAADYMQRARAAILAHGGADAVNSFTRFYLALLGQIAYDQCPVVPPEFVLLPKWFPVNLYSVSAWSRAIIVPLSIMSACQPARHVEPSLGIRELFVQSPENWPPLRAPGLKGGTGLLSWDRFFRQLDKTLKLCERWRLLPLRAKALRSARRWMLDRFDKSEGLGAIFPPMIWSVIALKCLGYDDDSPEMEYCHDQLDALVIDQRSTARLQPCKSPVWDTANTLRALADCGVDPSHEAIQRATRWLLDHEVRQPGDWSQKVDAEPGGWYFEYANEFYPDVDDTAMVLNALAGQLEAAKQRRQGGRDEDQDEADEATASDSLPPGLGVLGDIQDDSESEGSTLGGVTHDRRTGTLPVPDNQPAHACNGRAKCPPCSFEAGVSPQGAVRAASDATEDDPFHHNLAAAARRAVRWILAMQNRDGGWGAFDRDNDRQFLCHVPFADHNAMIDPSSPDLTGRVLEALGRLGEKGVRTLLPERPSGCFAQKGPDPFFAIFFAIDRAVAYLRRTQQADGSWFGRWGVNYIYGTWQVLVGLQSVDLSSDDPIVQAGANWLLAHQQACGGWGESPDSYEDPKLRGQGPVTASQTAWAILGLLAAGQAQHPAVARGIRYLMSTQQPDGTWQEDQFTGTGFPQVFYLRYHMYPIYFPLMALSRWAVAIGRYLDEADRTAQCLAETAQPV